MAAKGSLAKQNRYRALIEKIFFDHYEEGMLEFQFERSELESAANFLDIALPKNLGDVLYSLRFRSPMPDRVLELQPEGMEWIIDGVGRAKYVFKLVPISRIVPNKELIVTKIPDATPEIITAYALSDEQSLLAKVRYNRLIDIFLGLTSYSLQNHLRTSVKGIGQIEIDEIYVGVDQRGRQFVLPVQAKGGTDQLSVVQSRQDIKCCEEKFPQLVCRPISVQFMGDAAIAMFELTMEGDAIKIVDERHYRLVQSRDITPEDLRSYLDR